MDKSEYAACEKKKFMSINSWRWLECEADWVSRNRFLTKLLLLFVEERREKNEQIIIVEKMRNESNNEGMKRKITIEFLV